MILLVGGVYRAGKSALARRLMRECGQPYLGLDVLKMALAQTGFPIDPEDQPTRDVASAMWPLVRALCINMIDQCDHYIVEGELVPALVDELGAGVSARRPRVLPRLSADRSRAQAVRDPDVLCWSKRLAAAVLRRVPAPADRRHDRAQREPAARVRVARGPLLRLFRRFPGRARPCRGVPDGTVARHSHAMCVLGWRSSVVAASLESCGDRADPAGVPPA